MTTSADATLVTFSEPIGLYPKAGELFSLLGWNDLLGQGSLVHLDTCTFYLCARLHGWLRERRWGTAADRMSDLVQVGKAKAKAGPPKASSSPRPKVPAIGYDLESSGMTGGTAEILTVLLSMNERMTRLEQMRPLIPEEVEEVLFTENAFLAPGVPTELARTFTLVDDWFSVLNSLLRCGLCELVPNALAPPREP
eukprot:1943094-Amphidinium_carterae.1